MRKLHSSFLGPLLFNIFMSVMFLIMSNTYFTGYADDDTPIVVRDNIKDVKTLHVKSY